MQVCKGKVAFGRVEQGCWLHVGGAFAWQSLPCVLPHVLPAHRYSGPSSSILLVNLRLLTHVDINFGKKRDAELACFFREVSYYGLHV